MKFTVVALDSAKIALLNDRQPPISNTELAAFLVNKPGSKQGNFTVTLDKVMASLPCSSFIRTAVCIARTETLKRGLHACNFVNGINDVNTVSAR